MEPRLPYGLRGDRLLHISEVESGLACGCVCPECRQPLIARKGRKTTHHFAHYELAACANPLESLLHRLAKQLLAESGWIRLPAVTLTFSSFKPPWMIAPPRAIPFEKVLLEKKMGRLIPDLVLYHRGKPLIVEIAVTHPADADKRRQLEQDNISALEISLSPTQTELPPALLRQILVEEVSQKQWLFNARVAALKKRLSTVADWKSYYHHRGALLVNRCPLREQSSRSSAVNVHQDCFYCPYCLDVSSLYSTAAPEAILCAGRCRVATYEDYRRLPQRERFDI